VAAFNDEMLTIEELAAYLKLKPQTIYKWAQTGKVPGAKFGKEWRFRRSSIEKWIDSQIPALPSNHERSSAKRKARRAADGSADGPGRN
jgi:excisionase family DNA binding protein